MKFFKAKSEDSRSRRSARLQALRLREIGMFAGLLGIVGLMGFAGYHGGFLKNMGGWAVKKAFVVSADAGFKVKDILITGRQQVPAEELLMRLSIRENMPIFAVSVADMQKSVAGISWVKSVSVSRRLPDAVVISLDERVPLALWQHKKKISVIDGEGIVLTSDGLDVFRHLPLVVGEDARQHAAELLSLLNAEPLLMNELVSAARVGKRRWDLHLKNGVSVKLPEKDVGLALRRLALLESEKNILGRDISGVDLRQPERMTVSPAVMNKQEK